MDFNCKYIDKKEGYCLSPELDDTRIQCFSFNYTKCSYFPKMEIQNIIKPERENNLEKESKEE